jgi:hypothetical protein
VFLPTRRQCPFAGALRLPTAPALAELGADCPGAAGTGCASGDLTWSGRELASLTMQ